MNGKSVVEIKQLESCSPEGTLCNSSWLRDLYKSGSSRSFNEIVNSKLFSEKWYVMMTFLCVEPGLKMLLNTSNSKHTITTTCSSNILISNSIDQLLCLFKLSVKRVLGKDAHLVKTIHSLIQGEKMAVGTQGNWENWRICGMGPRRNNGLWCGSTWIHII